MAGLLGNFKNPFGSGGLLSDPNVRLAMGAEMLRGGTLGEQLGNGLNAGAFFSEKNKTKRDEQAKLNQTVEWLKSMNPELAQAVEMGALSGADAYKMQVDSQKPKHTEFQDRADAASQYGLDPNSPEGRAFILGGKLNDPNAPNGVEWGMNPVPMQDSQGNWAIGQMGSNNTIGVAKTPEGYTIASPFDKSASSTEGKAVGAIRASLPTSKTVAQNTSKLVDDLLNDPDLPDAIGPIQGKLPSYRPGAIRVDNRIKQLKGRAFLEARQMLKGGGQITDFEGERAEAAMARMDQAQSEPDFIEALTEFKSAVNDGYAKLEAAYGGAPQVPMVPQSGGGRTTSSGVGYTVE